MMETFKICYLIDRYYSDETPLTENIFQRLRHKKVGCRSEAIASSVFHLYLRKT